MTLPATGDPILRTKIQIPRIRPQRVERERLIGRLREASWSRLTLVSAPAGFGKTTLLAAWAAAADAPVAWLTLEQADNALERFLRYLASALGKAVPGVGAGALAMLATPQPLQPEAFLASLINDLAECDGPLTLVIDDYHLIEARPIHAALDYLLEHLPDCLRLVIAGRADPPLSLARLRAQGELVELRGADLRFTAQETADFLNQVMGLHLSEAEILAIEERTEGWIAGLQLAALSLQDRPDTTRFLRVFTGSHRYVLDYLVEEVLRRQPEEIQQFLLETSILEKMNGPLCDALRGEERYSFFENRYSNNESRRTNNADRTSQEILDYLDRSNLFLQPLDEERNWFRYHMLFADLLRFRLEQIDPERLPELHRRAAGWYENNTMFAEAMRHYLAAGDTHQAAFMVEREAEMMLYQGQFTRFLSWTESLPQSLFETHPRLHILIAWSLISTNQIALIDSHLDQAEQGLAQFTPGVTLPGSTVTPEFVHEEVTSTRAIVAALRNDYAAAIRLSEAALATERAQQDGNLRASIMIGLGVAYRAESQTARAEQTLGMAGQTALASKNYAVALAAFANQGDTWLELGDLNRSEACYRQALAVQTEMGMLLPMSSLAYSGLSEIVYERGDLPAALDLVRKALEQDKQWGSPDVHTINLIRLARILLECGDPVAGWEALEGAEEEAHKHTLNMFDGGVLQAFEVMLWLYYGKPELARAWLERLPPAPRSPLAYFDEPRCLSGAEVMVTLGEEDGDPRLLERALTLLEALLPIMRSRGQNGWVVPCLALMAHAHSALGRTERALACLEDALEIAAPQGYQSTFTRQGAGMASLLRLALATTRYSETVAHILASFPNSSPDNLLPGSPDQPDQLSAREQEVLRLVVQGLSNHEIADRLVLAPGTVKRHLHNIFEKLAVTTRAQAIVTGRKMLEKM